MENYYCEECQQDHHHTQGLCPRVKIEADGMIRYLIENEKLSIDADLRDRLRRINDKA